MVVGLALLSASGLLVLWARKRRFDRTNEFGVERFSSYGGKVAAHTFDVLLQTGAMVCGLAGLLVLAFQFQDSWGWVITIPVFSLVLFLLM